MKKQTKRLEKTTLIFEKRMYAYDTWADRRVKGLFVYHYQPVIMPSYNFTIALLSNDKLGLDTDPWWDISHRISKKVWKPKILVHRVYTPGKGTTVKTHIMEVTYGEQA